MTLPAIIGALGSLGGAGLSALSSRSQAREQERLGRPARQFEERKSNLIDQLLASVGGEGKFGDLFATDEAAFQKSFVDPAKSLFQKQIVPQIQQASIAGGTQGSSSLDDQLLRAGVDMDQLLNQNLLQFQQGGQDRISSLLGNILGQQAPSTPTAQTTPFSSFAGGVGGLLGSDAFSDLISAVTKGAGQGQRGSQDPFGLSNPVPDYARKGFTRAGQ